MVRPHVLALERRVMLTTFTPLDGAGFTAALNSAQLGDTIILQAGNTYTGSFVLKNKTTGSGWITIQSSNVAQLPVEGVRVSPADAVNMPRIVSHGLNESAIRTEYGDGVIGAHHFKLIGLEIVGPANNSDLVNLVSLGTTDSIQNTLEEMPHHFVIDRCYMRPNVSSAQVRRAVALNSGSTDITNSYIAEIHQQGSDSQAIGGANGAGPYNIINNHLEAASENIMFGGSGCFIPGVVPSDIVIRGNYFVKPLSWMGVWTVKNLFELKSGRRILIEGNILENCWNSGQTGVAVVLKLDQYSASRPWHVTEDIVFRNNIVRHAAGGVTIQGRDYAANSPHGLVRRLSFSNNVFYDIQQTPWADWQTAGLIGGNFLYMTHGPVDVTFDHNTIINGRTLLSVDTPEYPTSNFEFTNNIIAHNEFGVFGDGTAVGDNTFTQYFNDAGARFDHNVIMDHMNKATLYDNVARPVGSPYYPNIRAINYWPTSWAAVGFVNQPGANFRLTAGSPFNNIASDGADAGADIDALDHSVAGAINGIWFAYKVLSTMFVKFEPPQLPIVLETNGADITASKWVTSLDLAGVTAISVIGSPADDVLQIHAPITPTMTFADSGGADLLEILTGTQSFPTNIGTASENLGIHVAAGAGALFNATQRLRSLDVDGAATLSPGGSKVLRVKDLAVAGSLDLSDNDLVWDYTGPSPIGSWTGSAYSGVTGLIAANDLFTSMSNSGAGLRTLGVEEASTALDISGTQTEMWNGVAVDATSVIVKYTYKGDIDLDGDVDGDDYFWIDSNVAQSGIVFGYGVGDIELDGDIDGDDYFWIDSNIAAQASPL